VALGKIADIQNQPLLAEIAKGKYQGMELRQLFADEKERNYIRCEAINALAEIGTLESFDREMRKNLTSDPSLIYTFYEAMQRIYRRQPIVSINSSPISPAE
jgi:hypothetical protein